MHLYVHTAGAAEATFDRSAISLQYSKVDLKFKGGYLKLDIYMHRGCMKVWSSE